MTTFLEQFENIILERNCAVEKRVKSFVAVDDEKNSYPSIIILYILREMRNKRTLFHIWIV